MDATFSAAAHAILARVTTSQPNIPGVVAMAANRAGAVYEGAAGVTRLGSAAPMTVDSVFALFSCTKAITGAAVLQLAERGLLDLDARQSATRPRSAGCRCSRVLTMAANPG